MLVSCSVENAYNLFGFKLKTFLENYGAEMIEVETLESNNVEPLFS
jgi:hypothetical protein